METEKWYVGQQVWDKTVSDEAGEVVDLDKSADYPIIVRFKDENITAYYIDGKRTITDRLSTLSTKPYEIKMEGFSQEVEEELPKKEQICWGKISTSERWWIGHFMEKNDAGYILSYGGISADFICNEITTKNPYAVEEENREPKVGDMVFAWDDENPSCVCGGILTDLGLSINPDYKYRVDGKNWKYCSLKNPLIK